ncbi:uncharacterized protein HaLaN_21143, partial [Haematococcus lacustris]
HCTEGVPVALQVAEERNEMLDERTGGGTIEVSTTFASHSLALFSHPHDDCCPLDSLDLAEVPPAIDVYRLLMPLAVQPDYGCVVTSNAKDRTPLLGCGLLNSL